MQWWGCVPTFSFLMFLYDLLKNPYLSEKRCKRLDQSSPVINIHMWIMVLNHWSVIYGICFLVYPIVHIVWSVRIILLTQVNNQRHAVELQKVQESRNGIILHNTVTFILPTHTLLTHLQMNQLSHWAFCFLMQVCAAAGGVLQALWAARACFDRKGLHLKKERTWWCLEDCRLSYTAPAYRASCS